MATNELSPFYNDFNHIIMINFLRFCKSLVLKFHAKLTAKPRAELPVYGQGKANDFHDII